LAWDEFLKEGATTIEDTLRSEGNLGGFHLNLVPPYSIALDLQFEGILVEIGGHLPRVSISSLLYKIYRSMYEDLF
jgi:hypothetical protein